MEILKPTIADFTNSTHTHTNAANGGTLDSYTSLITTASISGSLQSQITENASSIVSISGSLISTFGCSVDGGGSVPTSGSLGYWTVPVAGTITGWTIFGDVSGSAVIDVKKSTYITFPTTSSIADAQKPTLSSVQKNQSSSLSGWATSLSAGDVIEFVLESASTVTRVNVIIKWSKS